MLHLYIVAMTDFSKARYEKCKTVLTFYVHEFGVPLFPDMLDRLDILIREVEENLILLQSESMSGQETLDGPVPHCIKLRISVRFSDKAAIIFLMHSYRIRAL